MHNNLRAASVRAGGQVCAVFQTGELLLPVLLLVPYLAWVGVAARLNLAIVCLNGPFRSA